MQTVVTVGLDIAKNVFQAHGVDAEGGVVLDAALVKSWSEVKELILESYELVKPPKVMKAAKKSTPGKRTRR
jgi:hypothetical protein